MKPTPHELARADEINARFRAEAERHALRYRCADCVHVTPSTLTCSLGYPNTMLTNDSRHAISADGNFVFCKYFELV